MMRFLYSRPRFRGIQPGSCRELQGGGLFAVHDEQNVLLIVDVLYVGGEGEGLGLRRHRGLRGRVDVFHDRGDGVTGGHGRGIGHFPEIGVVLAVDEAVFFGDPVGNLDGNECP